MADDESWETEVRVSHSNEPSPMQMLRAESSYHNDSVHTRTSNGREVGGTPSHDGRTGPSVIVAHPGTQHSFQTALGVQQAGLLQSYVTGFYSKRPLLSAIGFLPGAARLESEFRRRRLDQLDERLVKILPVGEIIRTLAARFRFATHRTHAVIRWRNAQFERAVARMLKLTKPRAVICYDTCASKVFEAAKALGILCILDQSIGHVCTGMELLREEAERHPDFADSLSLTAERAWALDQAAKEGALADWILAGSEYVRQTMEENGLDRNRITVLPYGVDIERFRPAPTPHSGTLRVLFVGQISQRKGIKYLLQAVKELDLPAMELVLVGDVVGSGGGLGAYRDHFTHAGSIPHHAVHSLFRSADVFAYPSLHEGSAIAIYEALASGLPVITTPNSGSVVRDGLDGFIVPIRSVEALKEKLFFLYANKEFREEMARNARKTAEAWTWALYRQRLGSALRGVLQEADGKTAQMPRLSS